MLRPYIGLILLGLLRAQVVLEGVVVDSLGLPVPFAAVRNRRTQQGVLTDLAGRFRLLVQWGDSLEIRCLGYALTYVRAEPGSTLIILPAAPIELQPIVIRASDNPAYALVRRLLAAEPQWNPLRRPHAYKSYNKFTITLPDSLRDPVADSLLPPVLFLWETETEKVYLSAARQREVLVAQKIVGDLPIRSPFSPTSFQPLSLYESWLYILDQRIASPVGASALAYYDYAIRDTLYEGEDTLVTLSFFPRPGRAEWALTGQMVISLPDAALRSFQGEIRWVPPGRAFSPVFFKMQQHYTKLGDSLWFPMQLHAEIGLWAPQAKRDIVLVGRSRSFLWGVEVPPKEKKVFLQESVVEALTPREPQRLEPLTSQERYSYQILDSLIRASGLRRRWGWLMDLPALGLGRLAVGPGYLLLTPLLLYHEAEGWRPQIGWEISERLLPYARVGVWIGYGTYAQAGRLGTPWRYGGFIEVGGLNALRLFFSDDVREVTLPRLLDGSLRLPLGGSSPYESTLRAYAFRWEDLVRERQWGALGRLAVGRGLWVGSSAAYVVRLGPTASWRGYVLSLRGEYFPHALLLRRGALFWRAEYKGPRLAGEIGILSPTEPAGQASYWIQLDVWHAWAWGCWAEMEGRFSAGHLYRPLSPLWYFRLRTLSDSYVGMPLALAAHPVPRTSQTVAYLFYTWRIPNRRFPGPSWRPTPALHLQAAWAEATWYPEAGLSLQAWLPQTLLRLLPSLGLLQFGLYTSLQSPRLQQRWYFRLTI
ncbi:MAG: hypothetical protein NZ958_05645 [Bacteroidia bacterium]|nr:hypothetical protein [Bacteroidia bacterium]MDW8088936.1 carboxypeptidase-like regulatory domain-containing protein [Bacteroidia bacterium]